MRLLPIQLQPRHSLSGAAVMGQTAIRPTGFRRPVSHRADLPISAPAARCLPSSKKSRSPSDELSAVFDELLALREGES